MSLRIVVGKPAKAAGAQELPWEDMSAEEVATLASTGGLFGETQVFLLRGALYSERGEEFLDLAKGLIDSPHIFIFEEEKLLKREAEALVKAGAKVEKKEQAEKKAYTFDQFGVAAALGAKDKKRLWLGLRAAFLAGEKAEALAGLLAWKARQMGDIKLSRELTYLYHDSHRGAGELELLLERFALKL